MARHYSVLERIAQALAAGLTQAALARKLRVPASTLAGWRRGREPSERFERRLAKLTTLATDARTELRRTAKREGVELPRGVVTVPKVRRLKRRVEPTKRKPEPEYVPGRIIELSIEGYAPSDVFDLMWPYREQALQRARRRKTEPGSFRFVIRVRGLTLKRTEERKGMGKVVSYVARVMREKQRAGAKPDPIIMTRPESWNSVIGDDELRAYIKLHAFGMSGAYRIVPLAVRIYPPGR